MLQHRDQGSHQENLPLIMTAADLPVAEPPPGASRSSPIVIGDRVSAGRAASGAWVHERDP